MFAYLKIHAIVALFKHMLKRNVRRVFLTSDSNVESYFYFFCWGGQILNYFTFHAYYIKEKVYMHFFYVFLYDCLNYTCFLKSIIFSKFVIQNKKLIDLTLQSCNYMGKHTEYVLDERFMKGWLTLFFSN